MDKRTAFSTWARTLGVAGVVLLASGCASVGPQGAGVYTGKPVAVGQGTAHVEVQADAMGQAKSITIVLTEGALKGLPAPKHGDHAMFSHQLAMPTAGPQTVVNHVTLDWEAHGHEPPKVYDIPHFDFHFYLVEPSQRQAVNFKSPMESADPGQQPAAVLMPAGYVLPPGTAVPQMGAHAIDPKAPEFNGKRFSSTFIYGFYNKQLTFLEPMVTLEFLQTKPDFSQAIPRAAQYAKAGRYPGRYTVNFDAASKTYRVSLQDLQ